MRYSEFVMPLVKSVQELSAENENLRAENEMLKGKVAVIMQALVKAGIEIHQ